MTDLSLSGVLAGDRPKSMKFGLLASMELLLKSILLCTYTLVLLSGTVLRTDCLTENGRRGAMFWEKIDSWKF